MKESVLVVIPARWGSSRFPGKLLEDLGGRPLVVRTAQAALGMRTATRVVVATDDDWKLTVGQDDQSQDRAESNQETEPTWNSLLDNLAKDVLGVWLDGDQA